MRVTSATNTSHIIIYHNNSSSLIYNIDMDMDEEALKQGVPDPPSIDEFSNLEEDMTEDQESQVKNNVPREHEESCMTEDKEITTI